MQGRGKKINPAKNGAAAEQFTKQKRAERPKQVWVWTKPDRSKGHWEKANANPSN